MKYTQIVIFGGWSLSGCSKAFLLRDDTLGKDQQLLEIKTTDGRDALSEQDYFTCSGDSVIVSETQDVIMGGNTFHLFDHDTL